MSLNIYNFDRFDGIAETENQGSYELRIYFKGKCNVDVAICSRVEEGDKATYHLYNFIVDKDHLENMKDLDWFSPINKITLYIEKTIQPHVKRFIDYAIKNKVEMILKTKPF